MSTVFNRCRTLVLRKNEYSRPQIRSRHVSTSPTIPNAKYKQKSMHQTSPSSSLNTSGLKDFNYLSKYGPEFFIRGEQVQVITDPDQFYQVLKLKTKKAKRRITLASLYLGTGDLEKDLVSCIREACENAASLGNSDFEVNVLLDYTRGSRGERSSRTMLYPLLSDYTSSVNVSLYHTPDLRGTLKKIIPDRFNETIGLTHIKVYLFDDSFIISGANLSQDYFTNRQDRYILFNDCPELANFFNDLIKSIMAFSLSLSADKSVHLAPNWDIHPIEDSDDGSKFKVAARRKIESVLHRGECQNVMKTSYTNESNKDNLPPDTVVYPLVQMGPFGIDNDEKALLELLKSSQPQDDILLASGYFNLTDHYMSVILEQSRAKFSILMASPQANGFLGAKGIAGAIPYSYIYLAHQFYQKAQSTHQLSRISLMEYFRDNWTFHGKGLWYYLPCQVLPTLTLVGSPNYGYRSVKRDLECEVAIVTENPHLREQLRQEHVNMYRASATVSTSTFERQDRQVPQWVKVATSMIKTFM